MDDHKRIGKGFNILAPIYDFCVRLIFGQRLLQFQIDAIRKLSKVETCAIIGGGTGEILTEAVKINLAQRYFYVEVSEKMRTLTQERIDRYASADVIYLPSDRLINEPVDLHIFPFMLDCYSNDSVATMLGNTISRMAPNGIVTVVDFNLLEIAGLRPRWYQRAFISLLYVPFNIIAGVKTKRLPKIDMLLRQHFNRVELLQTQYNGWLLTWVASEPKNYGGSVE